MFWDSMAQTQLCPMHNALRITFKIYLPSLPQPRTGDAAITWCSRCLKVKAQINGTVPFLTSTLRRTGSVPQTILIEQVLLIYLFEKRPLTYFFKEKQCNSITPPE